MADRQIQQVRNLYGEILGIADHLPGGLVINQSLFNLYNSAIDELSKVSNSDYSRFKADDGDYVRDGVYRKDTIRSKMGSILSRLDA